MHNIQVGTIQEHVLRPSPSHEGVNPGFREISPQLTDQWRRQDRVANPGE